MPLQHISFLQDVDNQLLQLVFQESELGLILLDKEQRIVTWNLWMTQHCQFSLTAVLGKKLVDIFPVVANSNLDRATHQALSHRMSSVISHKLNQTSLPLYSSAGTPIFQFIKIKPIKGSNGDQFCLIHINDISAAVNRDKQLKDQAKQTKNISSQLSQEMERAHVTLDSIADAVIATNEIGLITLINPVAERLLDIREEQVRMQPVRDIFKITSEDNENLRLDCPVYDCLRSLKTIHNDSDHVLLNKNGGRYSITDSVAPIIDSSGKLLGAVLVFRDVTSSRALTSELTWHAEHDTLTGLANRRSFEVKLKCVLEKTKIQYRESYVLYLDLDQFKVVNDTCGHDAGDELLKQVAMVFSGKLRNTDEIARLGGDEFGIILEHCSKKSAIAIAEKLLKAVEEYRFGWHTHSFKIGVSIGVTPITGNEAKAAEILSAVDSACYVAKDSGRNRLHFHEFDETGASTHQQEMQWISKIQKALDENRFRLYAQSIQDIRHIDDKPSHYEVLIRMLGPSGEIIGPGAFLPAAERFNLMASIDRWVIDTVFQKALSITSGQHPRLSINISGMSISDDTFLDHILSLLKKHPAIAERLCFEVTETAAIANLNKAIHFLSSLRSLGCKIALDDFGSGLSSFAYLKTFPIDYLKIDGFFVKGMIEDPINIIFVEAIHKIGHAMGLQTIAEFIENRETVKVLKEIGIDYGQGYGLHVPCPIEDVFN